MAYTKLSIAQITKLDNDYKLTQDQLGAGQLHHRKKAELEKKLETIKLQASQRLQNIIGVTEGYFETHQTNTKKWLSESEALLKNAQDAAARYRKDPTKQDEATYVENFAADITARKQRYAVDSHDFGEAWGDVREYNTANLPADALQAFSTERAKIMGDQRAVLAMGNQIAEAAKQAEALKAIIAKASMKKDMKGGANQRSIGVARVEATAVADELAEALRLLQNPVSMTTPRPSNIKSGAMQLKQIAAMKDYPATKKDWVTAHGFWQTTDQAQKNLLSRAASMEKVLATRTRGFRSNELKDSEVKAALTRATASVKTVKSLVKLSASDYSNAKKYHAVIEAKAKKAKFA